MQKAQRILITGTGSGFGRAAALRLLSSGHTVIATMRDIEGRNCASAALLEELAANSPGQLSLMELNVTSDASVAAAVRSIEQIHGGLDVAVNNAGIAPLGIEEAFTAEQLTRSILT